MRAANRFPTPGTAVQNRLILGHDGELEVADRPRADHRECHLWPDAGNGLQKAEEAEFLGRSEAVQRLGVLTDEVVGEELDLLSHTRGREDGRSGVDAIPEAADFDDQGIAEDGTYDAVERGDHRGSPWG